MKKNKLMRVACALLVVTLLSTCVISGTFAKYVAQGSARNTVQVAKWSIEYKGEKDTAATQLAVNGSTPTVSFDLFSTVLDSDGSSETDVAQGKIAPGTKGAFKFTVENKSEVTAKVSFAVTETKGNIPLTFKVNGATGTSLKKLMESEAATSRLDMPGAEGASKKVYTVEWEWPFEREDGAKDSEDTSLGIAADKDTTVPKYDVTLDIIVEQVD